MKTLLLPLDGSPLSEQALPYAAGLAQRSGARIILVRATQTHAVLDFDAGEAQLSAINCAERDLEAIVARLRADGIDAEVHVYYDRAAPAILDAARRYDPGLIVMSTHGRSGLGRMVYGSVADDVLRHADVPVLLVPPTTDRAWAPDRPLTILVPLDGSDLAEEALVSAEMLADLLGARLRLLRVVEPPQYPLSGDGYSYIPFDDEAERRNAHQYLVQVAEGLAASGREVTTEVAVGTPSTLVPRLAQECQADVVAMATHGRGGLARLVLGSVATGTLQRTHVPLLLTRPASLAQPVSRPQTPENQVASTPSITLKVTDAELVLARQAIESLLLAQSRDVDSSAALRVLLGRLRVAEHCSTAMSTEAVGAQS